MNVEGGLNALLFNPFCIMGKIRVIKKMNLTRIWRYQLIIMILFLSPCTHAFTTDVSCIFETTEQRVSVDQHDEHDHKARTNKWYFWRTDKEVEVANAERSFGEKWIKSNQRNVFYQALYHKKNFLLNFQPVDLALLGKKENWENRSRLFPQVILKQLTKQGSGKFNQYQVVNYKGIVSGTEYQVAWLPEVQLPLRVEKTSYNKKIITELKEIYPLDKSPYKRSNTEKYEDMDYADIGDNESHPIVSQLQNNSGVGYFHHH